MKPPSFQYFRAHSIDEAIAALAQSHGEAKILAGGQSLVPMLNLHLTQPELLVDIARIPALDQLEADHQRGMLRIGAAIRQAAVEHSPIAQQAAPLLTEALSYVAHPAIRHRGTLVGNAVHADPAAEVPAVLLALDAYFIATGPRGPRSIPAAAFYVSALTTTLEPDELVTRVEIPLVQGRVGTSWLELARTHGNYALVGVGCQLELQDVTRETIGSARIALCGVGDGPVRASDAEARLVGCDISDQAAWQEAARLAAAGLQPPSDIHASADYRRELAAVLTRRAIARAADRALAGQEGR